MDPHLSEETMMASKFFVVIQTVVLIHLCPEMHAMAKLAKNRQLLAI